MAWRFHGRASTNPSAPRAYAVCDRCGLLYNHQSLSWQFDWRGNQLQNIRLLVCRRCRDIPQQQLRPVILPPDPVPISDPRPEPYGADNVGIGVVQSTEPPAFGPLIPED